MEAELPGDLQKAIVEGYAAVTNHPQHALLPIYRHRIYEALGATRYPGEPLQRHAHRTRLALDLLSVRRVLPIWEAERPDFSWPQRLMEIADGVLNGYVSVEVARDEADHAFALLEEVGGVLIGSAYDPRATSDAGRFKGVSLQAYFVCTAAVESLFVASGMFRFDYGDPVPEETDAGVDPWSSDTAIWASKACAGAVWGPSSDPAKRAEFWEWWLKEAVPQSRQASQQR